MNRLQSELQRLYDLPPRAGAPARALVLALHGPDAWDGLSAVWRGVQADLALPAPAIAVSGTDGLQLWFSLQTPVAGTRAAEFLARLQARYLPQRPAGRVRSLVPGSGEPLPQVPQQVADTGHWSAYVAPDLAPIFADTPWLDVEPGVDGQADLLARLESIRPAAFEAALLALAPAAVAPMQAAVRTGLPAPGDLDPRSFLQQVLNDETADLALRIEAAKALLPRA